MITVYTCINQDHKIQKKSSSGGVFYLLAREIIKNGGIVFGVRFNEKWEAIHTIAQELDDVYAMLGSKYVQSSVGDTYCQAEKYLKDGRYVLFSGTPCQITGLLAYLGTDYKNLLSVSVVCHGVPSNQIWKQYLQYIRKGREISKINFRDKTSGWLDYKIKIEFTDGTTYLQSRGMDVFMRGFLKNLSLRPSCYQCPFKAEVNQADITLGDHWGAKEQEGAVYDAMGVSLVLVHTSKGNAYLEAIKKYLEIKEIPLQSLYSTNPSLFKSTEKPEERDQLFDRKEEERLTYIAQVTKRTYIQAKKNQIKRNIRAIRDKILLKK